MNTCGFTSFLRTSSEKVSLDTGPMSHYTFLRGLSAVLRARVGLKLSPLPAHRLDMCGKTARYHVVTPVFPTARRMGCERCYEEMSDEGAKTPTVDKESSANGFGSGAYERFNLRHRSCNRVP